MAITETEHRFHFAQALASTKIEGHTPTPEFLQDCDAVVKGKMTTENALSAALARARQAAAGKVSNVA
jgi:hypothetical protein